MKHKCNFTCNIMDFLNRLENLLATFSVTSYVIIEGDFNISNNEKTASFTQALKNLLGTLQLDYICMHLNERNLTCNVISAVIRLDFLPKKWGYW